MMIPPAQYLVTNMTESASAPLNCCSLVTRTPPSAMSHAVSSASPLSPAPPDYVTWILAHDLLIMIAWPLRTSPDVWPTHWQEGRLVRSPQEHWRPVSLLSGRLGLFLFRYVLLFCPKCVELRFRRYKERSITHILFWPVSDQIWQVCPATTSEFWRTPPDTLAASLQLAPRRTQWELRGPGEITSVVSARHVLPDQRLSLASGGIVKRACLDTRCSCRSNIPPIVHRNIKIPGNIILMFLLSVTLGIADSSHCLGHDNTEPGCLPMVLWQRRKQYVWSLPSVHLNWFNWRETALQNPNSGQSSEKRKVRRISQSGIMTGTPPTGSAFRSNVTSFLLWVLSLRLNICSIIESFSSCSGWGEQLRHVPSALQDLLGSVPWWRRHRRDVRIAIARSY